MQPSIADENTRQRIIIKYSLVLSCLFYFFLPFMVNKDYHIPQVFAKQDNKKCRSVVNEQKFRKLGSC